MKVCKWYILILALICILLLKTYEDCSNAFVLTSSKTIDIPDKEFSNIGFTCTGMYFDVSTEKFYVCNIGKLRPNKDRFKPSVEILDKDFKCVLSTILLNEIDKDIKDVQGIAMDKYGDLLIAAPSNGVYKIDRNGRLIKKYNIKNVTGVAYSKSTNTVWLMTNYKLMNINTSGAILKTLYIYKSGQDQLFLDDENNLLYFSSGNDYFGDSYINEINLLTGSCKVKYVLKDSYAIEGITIIGNKLYVLNDGYYHSAKLAKNVLNVYDL